MARALADAQGFSERLRMRTTDAHEAEAGPVLSLVRVYTRTVNASVFPLVH